MSASDGRVAIIRPAAVHSATATLAARLATLPTASSAQGSTPPRFYASESARSVVDGATIMPSTDRGVSAATQSGCPCDSTVRCVMKVRDRAGDQRQHPYAAVVVHRIDPPCRS
jgi:hypothetical protein